TGDRDPAGAGIRGSVQDLVHLHDIDPDLLIGLRRVEVQRRVDGRVGVGYAADVQTGVVDVQRHREVGGGRVGRDGDILIQGVAAGIGAGAVGVVVAAGGVRDQVVFVDHRLVVAAGGRHAGGAEGAGRPGGGHPVAGAAGEVRFIEDVPAQEVPLL